MSKIFVDKIQKQGSIELNLPSSAPSVGDKLITDTNGNLSWKDNAPVTVNTVDLAPADSDPVLFGQWANYTNNYLAGSGDVITSEYGQFHTGAGDLQLGILTGRHSRGRGGFSMFKIPPRMLYMRGSLGEFSFATGESKYQDTGNKYNYPDRPMLAVFVKNTTGADITRTLSYRWSSYWGSNYEGFGVFTYVPNATNAQITANTSAITALTTTNIYSYGGSTQGTTNTTSVTIPAGKTICILLSASLYYYYSNNHYNFYSGLQLYNFNSFLTTGIEVDRERTKRALFNPARSSELIDIWK
jgi:hypothetical protein